MTGNRIYKYPAVMAATVLALLAGCAHHPASEQQGAWFCKPDSAIRYRGQVPKGAFVIRPAPQAGSCRHNR